MDTSEPAATTTTGIPGQRRTVEGVPTEPGRAVIGGVAVDLCTRHQLAALVERYLGDDGGRLVVASANLDHVHHFGPGGEHAGVIEAAEASGTWLVLLDGMPLVWRARSLTGRSDLERLAGADLLVDMLELARRKHRRVGFLGGTERMLCDLRSLLSVRMPDLELAGAWAPARTELCDPDRNAALCDQIRTSRCDLVVIGLGKPLQELWAARHAASTGAQVCLLFGAAADFLAGHAQRAPASMQRTGLEWLYRLGKEPRRMGRRYLIQGPPALLHTLKGH